MVAWWLRFRNYCQPYKAFLSAHLPREKKGTTESTNLNTASFKIPCDSKPPPPRTQENNGSKDENSSNSLLSPFPNNGVQP